MQWADEEGADSMYCRQLAQIFSTAVDQAKHGGNVSIAPHLKRPGKSISENERLQAPKLIQHKLIAALLNQPKRQLEIKMERIRSLNSILRPVRNSVRYFLSDLGDDVKNLSSMKKHNLWTSANAKLLLQGVTFDI